MLFKKVDWCTVCKDAGNDQGKERHEGWQDNDDTNNNVPEIRFSLFGPPAALTEEVSHVERDGQQSDEDHKDRREGDVMADGQSAAFHRPVADVVFRLLHIGVEDAAVDAVLPVVGHNGRTDADENGHGDRQWVHHDE